MAGIIAEELGADVKSPNTPPFMHDLGKALTHKMEGKHHHISGEMLRKYGAPEAVALAAEQHHDDMETTSEEPSLSASAMPLAPPALVPATSLQRTLASACAS